MNSASYEQYYKNLQLLQTNQQLRRSSSETFQNPIGKPTRVNNNSTLNINFKRYDVPRIKSNYKRNDGHIKIQDTSRIVGIYQPKPIHIYSRVQDLQYAQSSERLIPTNPDIEQFNHLRQIYTTLVTWDQLEQYLFVPVRNYIDRVIDRVITNQIECCICHLFHVMRNGIYIHIKDGYLNCFIPFANSAYVNDWHSYVSHEVVIYPNELSVTSISKQDYLSLNKDLPLNKLYNDQGIRDKYNPQIIADIGFVQYQSMWYDFCEYLRNLNQTTNSTVINNVNKTVVNDVHICLNLQQCDIQHIIQPMEVLKATKFPNIILFSNWTGNTNTSESNKAKTLSHKYPTWQDWELIHPGKFFLTSCNNNEISSYGQKINNLNMLDNWKNRINQCIFRTPLYIEDVQTCKALYLANQVLSHSNLFNFKFTHIESCYGLLKMDTIKELYCNQQHEPYLNTFDKNNRNAIARFSTSIETGHYLQRLFNKGQHDDIIDDSKNNDIYNQHIINSVILAPTIIDTKCVWEEYSKYKYCLFISDTFTWHQYSILMTTGCIIFKVNPRGPDNGCLTNRDLWYFSRLVPFVHYIPVKCDLSDLSTQLEWAQKHSKECLEIAKNSMDFYRSVVNKMQVFQYLHQCLDLNFID